MQNYVPLSEKKRFWKLQKDQRFRKMSQDPCQIFNYFYNNNDVFRFMTNEDFIMYTVQITSMMNSQFNAMFCSILGVYSFDRFILNRFLPDFRFKNFRLTANVLKFILIPSAIYHLYDQYMIIEPKKKMSQIRQKYSFGFKDYVKANKIFERALAVNRLQELLQKRDEFNWEGIPELPDSQ